MNTDRLVGVVGREAGRRKQVTPRRRNGRVALPTLAYARAMFIRQRACSARGGARVRAYARRA